MFESTLSPGPLHHTVNRSRDDFDGCDRNGTGWLRGPIGEDRYIDMFADVGAVPLGGNSLPVLAALEHALHGGIPIQTPNILSSAHRTTYAAKILKAHNEAYDARRKLAKAFFSNSGAEAMEAAIKCAHRTLWLEKGRRMPQGGFLTVAMPNAFHGRTMGVLGLDGGAKYHRDGFPLTLQNQVVMSDYSQMKAINPSIVVLSPVGGNGDVELRDRGWWDAFNAMLKRSALQHGYAPIIIYDDVQAAMMRCGAMNSVAFYHKIAKNESVPEPNILVLGKGVAMGYPMGVTMTDSRTSVGLDSPGVHFSTFGGSAFGAHMGLKMLRWCREDAPQAMPLMLELGHSLAEADWITDVVGCGGLWCGKPNGFNAFGWAKLCYEKGVIVGVFRHDIIKITPPLNLPEEDMATALNIMDACAHIAMTRRGM